MIKKIKITQIFYNNHLPPYRKILVIRIQERLQLSCVFTNRRARGKCRGATVAAPRGIGETGRLPIDLPALHPGELLSSIRTFPLSVRTISLSAVRQDLLLFPRVTGFPCMKWRHIFCSEVANSFLRWKFYWFKDASHLVISTLFLYKYFIFTNIFKIYTEVQYNMHIILS